MKVRRWAAVRLSQGEQGEFGSVAAEDAIPSGIRRRMGRLERLAVRCTMGVLGDGTTDEIVFCSRYGNVETLSALLRGIAENQITSPMAFSGSVHNAAPGLVGQIRKERLSHTAIAAGPHTLTAGLVECYARLTSDGCSNVVLAMADLPLPDHFRAFEDEVLPGLALALQLELAPGGSTEPVVEIHSGRAGALALLDSLQAGLFNLTLEGAPWPGLMH
ncbi:MAG TPA: beta-ketoacyl synthase chain length factor [Rhizomicrobium sp.]|nr:beta-ketoacyl synthase chain length factor [Rhizomicrobium sp.]